MTSELTEEEASLPRDEVGWYEKYGIKLKDLYPDDLEFLRTWRNHPDIQRFMIFREEITKEMQERWYRSIDPAREIYTMLVCEGERIGLTQLRHIDREKRSGEGGLIIFRPEHQNGLIGFRAALAGMDWNFLQLKLETVWIRVLKSNLRAKRFVRTLGFVLEDRDPEGALLHGVVDAERYFHAVRELRELIRASIARRR
jgi:UDP-4-amino-4,6-dideoxy-N-acetyl-beta-L-altrosamine N-acetyltransferase